LLSLIFATLSIVFSLMLAAAAATDTTQCHSFQPFSLFSMARLFFAFLQRWPCRFSFSSPLAVSRQISR
jgi:hypothetical protein